MVVIDASILLLFLNPSAPGPLDGDGNPVEHPKKRIEQLIAELGDSGTEIAIPTPALSEVLVKEDPRRVPRIVETLNKHSVFRIEAFDQRAAIELAAMVRKGPGKHERPKRGVQTYAKLKYDRQIVAIAKVCGATTIYSDDRDIQSIATPFNISVVGVAELPLPPEEPQGQFEFENADNEPALDDGEAGPDAAANGTLPDAAE